MRKVFSFLAVVAFLTFAVSSVYALEVANSTKTAKVTIPGNLGEFSWSFELKKVADNANATDITWASTDITIGGSNNWIDSEVYALINSTITKQLATIEIYQDNVNSAVYKATATYTSATDKTHNGLVQSTTSAGHTNGVRAALPFAWRVSTFTKVATNKRTVFPPTYSGDSVVEGLADGGQYFIDKSDTGFDTAPDKMAYRVFLSYQGRRYGGGVSDIGDSPTGTFYMYFGANFATAMGGVEYGSDRIVVRGFYE
ncbi:MAG: hypothetical protein LBD46_00020 [Endomicrobium sp.]|nr:hypothetical protein [Endomicrobium sp.]